MLLTYNKFWKTIGVLLGTWIVYGMWGFEFTVVTLLALLCAMHLISHTHLIWEDEKIQMIADAEEAFGKPVMIHGTGKGSQVGLLHAFFLKLAWIVLCLKTLAKNSWIRIFT